LFIGLFWGGGVKGPATFALEDLTSQNITVNPFNLASLNVGDFEIWNTGGQFNLAISHYLNVFFFFFI